MKLQNIEELVQSSLKEGQKFLSYECDNLLSSGENYGSVLLRLRIRILNENGKEEIMNCVGKTCPPSAFLLEAYNTKVTFKKEIAAYNIIVPVLNEFGKEKGVEDLIDFFPKCLGARISLDPQSNEVDENAILVLENLFESGYSNGDRFVGFDFDSSKVILNNLATLHAAVIAFKTAKPEEFKTKLLPHTIGGLGLQPDEKMVQESVDVLLETAALNHKCVPYLSKLRGLTEHMARKRANTPNCPITQEHYTTLIHNDYWLNNTMMKYENGSVIKNKMVDFQCIEYNSLGQDVIFFLYTSVAVPVLENHIDDLFKCYYDTFINILSKLDCDIGVYSYEAMLEEFGAAVKRDEFSHVLFMLFPILTLKGKARDLEEIEFTDFIKDRRLLHENFTIRMQFVLLDFVKRGWV